MPKKYSLLQTVLNTFKVGFLEKSTVVIAIELRIAAGQV